MTPTSATPALDPATTKQPPSPASTIEEVPFEDIIRAHNRFHDELTAGRIDPDGKLVNQHIAYYDGEIIDHDADAAALYQRIAARSTQQRELTVLYYLERFEAIPG